MKKLQRSPEIHGFSVALDVNHIGFSLFLCIKVHLLMFICFEGSSQRYIFYEKTYVNKLRRSCCLTAIL